MFAFIETQLFTRLADEHFPGHELWTLQTDLNDNVKAGGIIRGSDGVRKLRWAAAGPRKAWRTQDHLLLAIHAR